MLKKLVRIISVLVLIASLFGCGDVDKVNQVATRGLFGN